MDPQAANGALFHVKRGFGVSFVLFESRDADSNYHFVGAFGRLHLGLTPCLAEDGECAFKGVVKRLQGVEDEALGSDL